MRQMRVEQYEADEAELEAERPVNFRGTTRIRLDFPFPQKRTQRECGEIRKLHYVIVKALGRNASEVSVIDLAYLQGQI